jgi:carbamate kinase
LSQPLVVIAVGGNSLIRDAEHMSVLDQYQASGETAEHIAGIVELGYRVVVTHGNGPQVGFILLRSELAKDRLHQVPLESCVADTQGAIGYQIAQTLGNELTQRGIDHSVAVVITQAVVDPADPAFAQPSKPIGPFYSEAEAARHRAEDGWDVVEDAGRGWRRVVPSPRPLEIVEEPAIAALLDRGIIVVAAGGGGIPVLRGDDGRLTGQAAVIDKDATSRLLATNLGAEVLLVSTAVDKVLLDFGKPGERPIDRMTVAEARQFIAEGHFAPGSMRPKIKAAIDFLEQGGRRVVITQPHLLEDAMRGTNGTHVVP